MGIKGLADLVILLFVALWILSGVAVIKMGGKRQIGSKLTALLVYVFSPLVGLVIVALSGKRQDEQIDYYGEMLKLNDLHSKKNVVGHSIGS